MCFGSVRNKAIEQLKQCFVAKAPEQMMLLRRQEDVMQIYHRKKALAFISTLLCGVQLFAAAVIERQFPDNTLSRGLLWGSSLITGVVSAMCWACYFVARSNKVNFIDTYGAQATPVASSPGSFDSAGEQTPLFSPEPQEDVHDTLHSPFEGRVR